MPVDALQVATLVLLVAALAVGGWALRRARRRSREIQAQLENLCRGLARLEAALAVEERERARQDAELEQRSSTRLEEAVGPVLERMVELGRVQREAARVARAVAEGQVAPGVGAQLERHLAELAADLATDEASEP